MTSAARAGSAGKPGVMLPVLNPAAQMKASAISIPVAGLGKRAPIKWQFGASPAVPRLLLKTAVAVPAHWVPWSPLSPATVCAAIALKLKEFTSLAVPSVRFPVRSGWFGVTPFGSKTAIVMLALPPRRLMSIPARVSQASSQSISGRWVRFAHRVSLGMKSSCSCCRIVGSA
jgi:hypothetical protein